MQSLSPILMELAANCYSMASRSWPREATDLDKLPAESSFVDLEIVAYSNGAMPIGVTVTHNEESIFVESPK
jgi:hypothetical protein